MVACSENKTVTTVYVDEVKNIEADSLNGEWRLKNLSNIEHHLNLLSKVEDSISLNLLSNESYDLNTMDSTGLIVNLKGKWTLVKTPNGITINLLNLNRKGQIILDSTFNLLKGEDGLLLLSQLNPEKISTSFLKSN